MVSSEANELMEKARRYLELAKISLEKGFYSEVCFLSSLSVELYIKGVSISLVGSFPAVHDVREILSYIKLKRGDLEIIEEFVRNNRDKLKDISNEYLVSRYNLSYSYTKEDAKECLSIAMMVIKFGEELLRSVSGKD
jgi:HEPN domain-containing protein